ncbi:RDD family protein [Actinomadura graeca]|uniref:RDD family protein n=1 Tax=Actinomadura graeca TaxID=2750812 RepID=A0ABX8R037_9ACTN|nr:RDD family protein [Actinomadura graeca]QXJ24420.1 RDD family protein [Actinomadura graeca]
MSEPPQKPQDWQAPDTAPHQDEPADRPPPYQGSYGSGPAGAQPLPAYPQPGGAQQPYGQPAYGPPGHGGPGDHLAGRWARLGAALLDGLIVGVVSLPFLIQAIRWDRLKEISESGETATPSDMYDIPRLLIGYAVAFVLGFAYYTVLHARWGQTVGKRAAGIRLVRASDQAAVGWGQAAARQGFVYLITIGTAVLNLLGPAGGLVGIAGLLDNAWILWDARRQALHDKVAGTIVVKAPSWAPNPYAKHPVPGDPGNL